MEEKFKYLTMKMKRLQESGLIGCLNETGITSQNYKTHFCMQVIPIEKEMPLLGEWIKVSDRAPNLAEMAYIQLYIMEIAVPAIVTRSPFDNNENLYWHFINPRTGEMVWTRVMANDIWISYHLIKTSKDENEVQEL